jgi:hypothetical protein
MYNVALFLSEKYMLNVNQSGFRSGHSTITATTLDVKDLINALDTKSVVGLSKAFPTVMLFY